jgi:hypothetical protein
MTSIENAGQQMQPFLPGMPTDEALQSSNYPVKPADEKPLTLDEWPNTAETLRAHLAQQRNYESPFAEPKKTSRHTRLPNFASARWDYTGAQGSAEQRELNNFDNIAKKRPLPEDYRIEQYTGNDVPQNPQMGHLFLLHVPTGRDVGGVSWDKSDGYVHGIAVNEGHRHLTPYLLKAAHDEAIAQGGTGPTWSAAMSAFSKKMASRHAAPFMSGDHLPMHLPARPHFIEANPENRADQPEQNEQERQLIFDQERGRSLLSDILNGHVTIDLERWNRGN